MLPTQRERYTQLIKLGAAHDMNFNEWLELAGWKDIQLGLTPNSLLGLALGWDKNCNLKTLIPDYTHDRDAAMGLLEKLAEIGISSRIDYVAVATKLWQVPPPDSDDKMNRRVKIYMWNPKQDHFEESSFITIGDSGWREECLACAIVEAICEKPWDNMPWQLVTEIDVAMKEAGK